MGKIAAIILAAGLSRRMGQPKMLLPWQNTTVIGQVVKTLTQAISDIETQPMTGFEVVIVTGGAREAVEAEVMHLAFHSASGELPVRAVFNPQFETGEMMSSIRVGLAELGSGTEFALIGLGDQPQLSFESARRVVLASTIPHARLILPSFNMRRGHPWLVHRDLWSTLATAETGRAFLRAHEKDIVYVETDETVLKDLDTPDDYAKDLKTIR